MVPLSRRWLAALLLCGLCPAGALRAEPVPEEFLIEESDAIVVGRFATLIAVPGLTTVRGLSVLIVERPVFGRPAAGDWLLLSWSYRPFVSSCPPGFDPRAAAGHRALWFLELAAERRLAHPPHGWSLESVESLEQNRGLLRYLAESRPLSERLALVEGIVDARLAELRDRPQPDRTR
jgi:hypothetical protein